MKQKLTDHRQLLTRYLSATALVATVLAVLLWQQGELVLEQREIAQVVKMATQLRGNVRNISQAMHDAMSAKTADDQRRALDMAREEIDRLAGLNREIQATKDSHSATDDRFLSFYYSAEIALDKKVDRFVSESSLLAASLKAKQAGNLISTIFSYRNVVNELVTPLDLLIGQHSIMSVQMLASLRNMQVMSLILVLFLFVGMGYYIILPAKKLLKAQQEAHEEALRTIQERTDRLEQAKHDAEVASRSKTDFLSNISHEIRTPMTAILGYSDMLLQPSLSPQQRQKNIQIIRKNGRALLSLIDDILDISRIETGREMISKIEVGLPEIISEVSSLLLAKATEKSIQLNVVFEGELPEKINTDPVRLRQVLINVVGNAVKFTERGEVRLTIRYPLDEAGRRNLLTFTVSDTGCGIAPEAQSKLFTPFMQVDPTTTRRYGGTGIGLAISKRLAIAMGGDLNLVTSTPEVGSSFSVTIHPGDESSRTLTEHMTMTQAGGRGDLTVAPNTGLEGVKVLVVEDSDENRELFASYLENAGAITVTAADGQEGLDRALQEPFNVILMDIQMPKVDGYEAVAALRARNYTAPIVALTARASSEDSSKSRAAGFDLHLPKPVDATELVYTVGKLTPHDKRNLSAPRPIVDKEQLSSTPPRIRAIVEKFLHTMPQEVNALRKACENGDWKRAAEISHRFRGTAGNCGFSGVMNALSEFEDELRKSEAPVADDLTPYVDNVQALVRLSETEFNRLGSN